MKTAILLIGTGFAVVPLVARFVADNVSALAAYLTLVMLLEAYYCYVDAKS